MPKLGVNIDHIATLRQLRFSSFPDVVLAAQICETAGADSIVAHLREDRRHVQDADIFLLREKIRTRLNLEMSISPKIVDIACRVKPDQATLVPEKRKELTTEGGLDVSRLTSRIGQVVERLKKSGIMVSLFIESDRRQIKSSAEIGADAIELHTGRFANAHSVKEIRKNLTVLKEAASYAVSLGFVVNAGHGLDYGNVCPVAHISRMNELNVGYAIVCRSVFVGLGKAVSQMKRLVER